MEINLKDKVAIVTGAASGIGLAIAERFSAEGAKVVLSDLQTEKGTQSAERINGLFIEGDLSQRADCKNLVDKTVEAFGTVHILVNNAGFQHIAPLENFSEDIWDKMVSVMLTAPFLLTRYAWPHLKKQQWGRVINMGSVLSVRASAYKACYSTVKHGLLGLTRVTALEGGPHGITAHTICPSYVRTPLVENQIADQASERGMTEDEVVEKVIIEPTALKRLLEPAEVAALILFLCHDEASALTGAPVMIDAGMSSG